MFRMLSGMAVFSLLVATGCSTTTAQEAKMLTPADGHTIHVVAPHLVDGKVMGPFHHYCKPVSDTVIQCLIFESTDPKALLRQVEYFIAKSVSRPNVPLDVWNKYYHDHEQEIASGRVQILDMPADQAKSVADLAAKTDGIVFELWRPHDAKAPTGEVGHPQSVSHKHRTQ